MALKDIIKRIKKIKDKGIGEFVLSLILVYDKEDLKTLIKELEEEGGKLTTYFEEDKNILKSVINRLKNYIND